MAKKSPIERAARALCAQAGNPENTKFEGKPMWQSYLPQARAVLIAIREPSEAMLKAGEDAIDDYAPGTPVDLAWKDMIHAALTEE